MPDRLFLWGQETVSSCSSHTLACWACPCGRIQHSEALLLSLNDAEFGLRKIPQFKRAIMLVSAKGFEDRHETILAEEPWGQCLGSSPDSRLGLPQCLSTSMSVTGGTKTPTSQPSCNCSPRRQHSLQPLQEPGDEWVAGVQERVGQIGDSFLGMGSRDNKGT